MLLNSLDNSNLWQKVKKELTNQNFLKGIEWTMMRYFLLLQDLN